MGEILKQARGITNNFAPVATGSYKIDTMLMQPQQKEVRSDMGGMSADEQELLFNDLDIEFPSSENNYLAQMIWEESLPIRDAVRVLKSKPGAGGAYTGILANNSTDLEVWPLRPKDVGGTLLNSGGTALC
ncbi:MAG: hypothetical protein PHU23_14665, partial [Dehalococcoidales bacterium]|nr:hypothetical protein [Dehalococcoidales bacterium]